MAVSLPSFIAITEAKLHDVNILDELVPEPGAIYVMNRGYLDFERLYALHQAPAFFVIRSKSNADLYRCRWQVETFFKWIKEHLRIKALYGTSENAVKTQIWIAVAVYVLVATIKKRMKVGLSLYTTFQVLSLTLFEKMTLHQAVAESANKNKIATIDNQLKLFNP
jgi:hypothetical protein